MSAKYPLPFNEVDRLLAVEEHGLQGADSEAAFDDLALLAAEICEAPIALITLIHEQRQWIISRVGVDVKETQRDISFCTHAICQPELFIIPDALVDERFAQNPLVIADPSIRFYAGAPLLSREGYAVGTLCVLDRVPRELTPCQQRALRVLSHHVCAQLELRRTETLRRQAEESLARANANLERRVAERTAQLQSAVQQAETSKRHIADIVERMSDGVVAFDSAWRFDYVNQKAAELMGHESAGMLGRGMLEVFPEASGSPFLAMCQRSAHEQRSLQMDAYYAPREVWFECRCYPSREGVSIFFQDITSRKKAELHLERERQLSEAIIASLPGTFYFFDEDGRYLRWNDGAEKTTGLTKEEYGQKQPIEKVALADRERVGVTIRKVFDEGNGSVEARLLHVSGEERWHLLTGRTLEVEGRRCLVGIGVDISDRKAAEMALEEANSRLELAVSASGLGLWAWDIPTHDVFYSQHYKQQLGCTDDDYPDEFASWEKHVHPDDLPRMRAFLAEFLAGPGSEYEEEYRMRHQDGSYRWMFTRARLHRDERGEPLRLVGGHIDITERRKTEEALRASREQLRALAEHQLLVREEEAGRIARELHDELGASLTGLKFDLSWVDRRLGELECAGCDLLRVRIGVINERVDETVDSMRKICQALRPAVLDQLGLAEAIDWQCFEFQTRTGVCCAVQRDESFSLGGHRAIAVFRILQELLTNVSRHAEAKQVTVRAYCESGDFHLMVSDDGCGLPANALSRKDRFGLVGVQERALGAAGTVRFQPSPSGGTTVSVCLPAHCGPES